ncbi:hypothetical protein PF008_g10974 [Phytophthora fragariae]|uniref:ELMO domain-containing protein n=1 Tax=Phytophthora fragariae TaxID=53985 RepID=A0A6G0RTQ6_9STRA|nr:hypothetical protein PF008_g10974 [Phytophthora fragariae]
MAPRECGVLCRYFFQQMLLEADDARLEEFASSLLLSARPTLGELRRKFPFEGAFHFRLQVDTSAGYCWRDLADESRPLSVASNGEIRVKVLQLEAAPSAHQSPPLPVPEDLVDVPEDRQFGAFFHWQNKSQSEPNAQGYPMPQPQQDVGGVLFGVKKALASKMKGSAMAQTLQKHSAQVWEKVTAAAGVGGTSGNAPPTAASLAQLAKLVGAMKAPLHPANHEHVEMLQRLWTSCFDTQPFATTSAEWNRLGFRHGDPMREMQFLLPLQCLVFFHEVHRTVALPILNDQSGPEAYSYAMVGSQIAYVLSDLLQLRDGGGCLGSERPFWRLFEDPMAFFELYCISFRAFDASWKLNSTNSSDISFHLNYVGDFAQELLRRGPENVASLVEHAYQLQNW